MSQRRLRAAFAAVALTAAVAQVDAAPAGATASGVRHVIVRSVDSNTAAVRALVRHAGGHVDRTLGLIHAVAATVPAAALPALRAGAEVTADARVHLAGARTSVIGDDSYVPSEDDNSMYRIENIVGARQVWKAGYTGRGVDVALVDSGVAPVPGILGSNVVQGPDLTEESQDPLTADIDTYGHGTHLAGIIAGHDADVTNVTGAWNDTDNFLGVAPDARIVSVKVADSHGLSDVSQVIAGIDWVVEHAHDRGMNIRVMNLSFGTDSAQAYTIDPLAYAAEQAWAHGIVVVTSAGNSGTDLGRLSDPAIDPFVVAVGADDPNGTNATSDDSVPSFSSVGDGTRDPDLVAPGVHVQSLRTPGSYIDQMFSGTGAINSRFFRGSGTSQAAAVVSGVAALIVQQQPDLTPDQVKYLLVSNAVSIPALDEATQGAGVVRVKAGYGNVPAATQTFAPSTGTGRLDLPRGTSSWKSSSWRSSSWASISWASSSWASSTWASSTWASSSWAASYWR